MPRTTKKWSKKKRTFRKKRYARRKGYRAARRGMLTLTPGRALFPRMVRVNLRYEDASLLLSTTAGAVNGRAYRATSPFDPDTTGVSSQPRGYDQIAPFFESWIVAGAKITAYAQSNATGAANAGFIAAITSNEATISPDPRDVFEDRFTRKRGFGAASGGPSRATVVAKYSAKKWHGAGGRILMQNADLIGAEGTNPAQNTYFQVVCAPQQDGAVAGCLVRVVIDYSVIFFNPKLIPPST